MLATLLLLVIWRGSVPACQSLFQIIQNIHAGGMVVLNFLGPNQRNIFQIRVRDHGQHTLGVEYTGVLPVG